MFKGKVCIGGGGSTSNINRQTVMVYDPQLDSFDTLPPYSYLQVVLNGCGEP